MAERIRYAVVGLGSRARMFTAAITGPYRDTGELVGFCDPNPTRMAFHNKELGTDVPRYRPADFIRMLAEQRVDRVIVTSIDRTHHRYIVAAMEHGCDVVTEKPLTVDAERCREILVARERTGRRLTVSFNYRYAPRNAAVKRLIQKGAIGAVQSVHLEWLLDTRHGADYFRRWHRDKRNSGGLMVHKASHHFDLVNWWLSAVPETVFGFADLRFYGRERAEERGAPVRGEGPWAIDLDADPTLRGLYRDAEGDDGYRRDQDVFGDGISIEDDMAVLVRYAGGATLSYHLTAYSPWEGYRVMFNGTRGRLELDVVERSYVSGGAGDPNAPGAGGGPAIDVTRVTLQRLWNAPEVIPIEEGDGGHGGGDARLLADLFGGSPEPDPLGRAAGHLDGARAMLVGAAANRSFATGRPVRVPDLISPPIKELFGHFGDRTTQTSP
jgi:predicted dehydrogenase